MLAKQLEKLSLFVSAIAATVVLIACIVIGAQLYIMAAWVSLTIALFYVIGELIRFFLVTRVFPPENEEDFEGEEEEEEEEEEEDYSDQDEEERVDDEEYYDEEGEEEDFLEDEMEPENEPVENAFLD